MGPYSGALLVIIGRDFLERLSKEKGSYLLLGNRYVDIEERLWLLLFRV